MNARNRNTKIADGSDKKLPKSKEIVEQIEYLVTDNDFNHRSDNE